MLGKNFRIVKRRDLSDINFAIMLEAPDIARKALPGQFVIVRSSESGERIPLTLVDWDAEQGTIELIIQVVGRSTRELSALKEGETILDVVGPLGLPLKVKKHAGKVVCVGGGVGIAPLYPKAKALKEAGNYIISILGARSKDLLMLVDEMRAISDELIITTDDGSAGQKALVTEPLKQMLQADKDDVSLVIAIGPPIMMKFVSLTTKEFGTPTEVSLNPIMVDGTGMCGGCRVKVNGENKFACVDGPIFDGHAVDWNELIQRLGAYKDKEHQADQHYCKLNNIS
jgi:ferredoxin--NADP+ reductase